MGADRLFFEHAPKDDNPPRAKRKRKRRLIDDVHPALRRAARRVIKRFPPELRQQFQGMADDAGVTVDSVLLYGLILRFSAMSSSERLQSFHDVGLFLDADEQELDRATAGLKRALLAEMARNRKQV